MCHPIWKEVCHLVIIGDDTIMSQHIKNVFPVLVQKFSFHHSLSDLQCVVIRLCANNVVQLCHTHCHFKSSVGTLCPFVQVNCTPSVWIIHCGSLCHHEEQSIFVAPMIFLGHAQLCTKGLLLQIQPGSCHSQFLHLPCFSATQMGLVEASVVHGDCSLSEGDSDSTKIADTIDLSPSQ